MAPIFKGIGDKLLARGEKKRKEREAELAPTPIVETPTPTVAPPTQVSPTQTDFITTQAQAVFGPNASESQKLILLDAIARGGGNIKGFGPDAGFTEEQQAASQEAIAEEQRVQEEKTLASEDIASIRARGGVEGVENEKKVIFNNGQEFIERTKPDGSKVLVGADGVEIPISTLGAPSDELNNKVDKGLQIAAGIAAGGVIGAGAITAAQASVAAASTGFVSKALAASKSLWAPILATIGIGKLISLPDQKIRSADASVAQLREGIDKSMQNARLNPTRENLLAVANEIRDIEIEIDRLESVMKLNEKSSATAKLNTEFTTPFYARIDAKARPSIESAFREIEQLLVNPIPPDPNLLAAAAAGLT